MRIRDIYILAFIFSLCQIADGLLTYIGVTTFGNGAEGNPLLSFFMHEFGAPQTLVFAKFLAVLIVVSICRPAKTNLVYRIKLADTLRFMIVFYVIVAICPWMLLLA